MQDNRRALIAATLLSALVTFIIYIPSIWNGFVNWDDPKYVYENPIIQTLDLAFLKWAFTESYFSNWHPLTMISFAVDYALWGLNPMGYHIENIVFHTINTALVAVLAIRLITIARPLSAQAAFAAGFFPALIFGIHPLHVESVAWISERKDVLSALFFIASLLFYLRYAQKRKALCYVLTLVSFALAIMSKSMAVTLPAVLLLIDFYPLRRLSVRAVVEKLPFFAISVFASMMAIYSQTKTIASLDAIPLDLRFFSALRAYAFYLEKFFVPVGLAPFYPLPTEIDPFGADYLVSYAVIAAVTIICLAALRYRAFITAWLFFLGTLLPVIGLIQVGAQAAADRYMYLPSLSLVILIGAGAALIIERNSKTLLGGLAAIAAVATVGLSIITVSQSAIWKNPLTLWDRNISLYPEASMPYVNRGTALIKMKELERGLDDLNRAVELNPRARVGLYNRALALKNMGRYEEALSDLNRAIAIKPDSEAHNNRGNVRKRLGDNAGAVEDYRKALELEPKNAATWFNLALVLENTGDLEGAFESAQRAASLGMAEAGEYLEYLKSRMEGPEQVAE